MVTSTFQCCFKVFTFSIEIYFIEAINVLSISYEMCWTYSHICKLKNCYSGFIYLSCTTGHIIINIHMHAKGMCKGVHIYSKPT